MDPICGLFERPSSRPRSPESRMSRLAFLSEITDEQLKTYSPSQVARVLEQRSHVRTMATRRVQLHHHAYSVPRTFLTRYSSWTSSIKPPRKILPSQTASVPRYPPVNRARHRQRQFPNRPQRSHGCLTANVNLKFVPDADLATESVHISA